MTNGIRGNDEDNQYSLNCPTGSKKAKIPYDKTQAGPGSFFNRLMKNIQPAR
ncbi:hypothetical protein [Candidatus Leptofilum sp.]|uniref:hypothetical protein n=1 Tax=Candidatus Leptofilum sp. TaxID=3241576 RepID=UPI003B59F7A4